jgi:hypothetical protein
MHADPIRRTSRRPGPCHPAAPWRSAPPPRPGAGGDRAELGFCGRRSRRRTIVIEALRYLFTAQSVRPPMPDLSGIVPVVRFRPAQRARRRLARPHGGWHVTIGWLGRVGRPGGGDTNGAPNAKYPFGTRAAGSVASHTSWAAAGPLACPGTRSQPPSVTAPWPRLPSRIARPGEPGGRLLFASRRAWSPMDAWLHLG